MNVSAGLSLRTAQQAGLAPALQQSAAILQMNVVDLAEHIQREIEANPFIEVQDRADAPVSLAPPPRSGASGSAQITDDLIGAPQTLEAALIAQLGFLRLYPADRDLAVWLIGMLDDSGYLRDDPQELADLADVPVARLRALVERLKTLDPAGVFAAGLSECLLLQLAARGGETDSAARLLAALRGTTDRARLARETGLTPPGVDALLAQLKALDPAPAARWREGQAEAVQPDLFLTMDGEGRWQLSINERILPALALSTGYYHTTLAALKHESDRRFARETWSRASWLIECVRRRSESLLRVGECLIRRQPGFVQGDQRSQLPLSLKDVADELGLHLSTISRVTSSKFISTPRGTLPLRQFFARTVGGEASEAMTVHVIKDRMARILSQEDRQHPLPDGEIQTLLGDAGIRIARRTVTKYREQLGIPSCRSRAASAARLPALQEAG